MSDVTALLSIYPRLLGHAPSPAAMADLEEMARLTVMLSADGDTMDSTARRRLSDRIAQLGTRLGIAARGSR